MAAEPLTHVHEHPPPGLKGEFESHNDLPRHDPPAAGGAPSTEPEAEADNSWLDLLMYGMEHVVRGSDTGTLVAFAALAFQQIRGKADPHHSLGCGILLISVLMCAVVHLAIGNAYVERAKEIFRRSMNTRRHRLIRWVSYSVAWIASILQFVFVLAGTLLILFEKAPPFVVKHVLPYFQVH
jgi:hypothetical protein